MNINDIKNIKKNSNGFSFTQEMLNEVNNIDFAAGEVDYLKLVDRDRDNEDPAFSRIVDTRKSYLWSTISAITEDVGEAIYQNILNYIDNVCDIDTCSVKALQSMVQILGTHFSIFDALKACPLDVLDLINVFSIRKDYLLNSEKVNEKLLSQLCCLYSDINSDGILARSKQALDKPEKYPLSSYPAYIISEQLDNVISTAFHVVLSSHIFQTYNDLCSTAIVKDQFNNISCNDFLLSSVYDSTIDEYKIKWNIPGTFDESVEVDKIENGISSLDDYTLREQNVLSLEITKRNAAKYDLEPRTRYQYYRQRDVKEYIKFVEQLYGEHIRVYVNSQPYALDKSYIEISSLNSADSLIIGEYLDGNSTYPVSINTDMLESVEGLLVNIVNQIRGIREYLKSHAQRTYMKGTFLLIAYIINEYLNNNTIPTLKKLKFLDKDKDYSNNTLQIVEYIDQTQYNNLQADIKEDLDNREVNPVFWEGTAANGNANELDTTNIFRPADKLKLVTSSTFSSKEIENFYLDVLNNVTGQRRLKQQDRNIYDFLSAVFAIGADSSYRNSDGKLMCELQNTAETDNIEEWNNSRRFTVDIDKYVSDVSTAYDSARYILSSFTPVQNSSLQYQFADALDEYKQQALNSFTEDLNKLNLQINGKIDDITVAIDKLNAYSVQFQNYETIFQNLIASYTAYIPNSVVVLNSTSLYDKLGEYNSKYIQLFPAYVINEVRSSISNLRDQIDTLTRQMQEEMTTYQVLTKIFYVNTIYDFYHLASIIKTTPLKLQTVQVNSQISNIPSKFEAMFETLMTYFSNLKTTLLQQQQNFYSAAQASIIKTISGYNSRELSKLSGLMIDYIDEQFSLKDCVSEISARVDYSNDEWYQYKTTLFQKYSGLSTSDLPFYYIENTRHPSYQIHPCLSNFIEAIDYRFPIDGLVGLAETTIRDVVKTATSLNIDRGMLLAAWNNPLNSNENYMSRYEKSNHIDEKGRVNKYFGHDGFFHPSLTSFAPVNNYSKINNIDSIYSGLNISIYEYNRLNKILVSGLSANDTLKSYATSTASTAPYYILKYGLDIYDNAYMIIANSSTDKSGILWFRPKNYPTAFPALVYNNKQELISELSQFEKYSTSDGLETNAALSKLQMTTILHANAAYQTPLFADFTFSTTRKVIILNGIPQNSSVNNYQNSIPVHAVVKQIYDDKELRYKRYLTPDSNKESQFRETLSTDVTTQMACVCPFIDGNNIGQVYAKLGNTIGSYTPLSIDVIQYYANSQDLQYESKEIFEIFYIKDQNIIDINDIKFSSKQNREFSCAFLGTFSSSLNVNMYTDLAATHTYKALSAEYPPYLKRRYEKLLTSEKNSVQTIDFQVIGETILSSAQKIYAPVNDMGFIPLYSTPELKQQQIFANYYEQEFDNKQTLKFECLHSSYSDAGNDYPSIDFKFVCPIRVETVESSSVEQDESSLGLAEAVDVLKFNDETKQIQAYPITNIHVFDSYFNTYVISETDAMFWDLTEAERFATLSTDILAKTLSVDTYRRFANYDVMKYLIAQRDESPYSVDEHGSYASAFNDDENFELITEPCLVPEDVFTTQLSSETHPYNCAYLTKYTSEPTLQTLIDNTYCCSLNSSTNLSVVVSTLSTGGFKLDFNSCWYFRAENSDLENIRNHKHLFLNLDQPGDSGYLNIYNEYTNNGRLMITLFIKNISDEIPKFVLRKVYSAEYADESSRLTEIAIDKSSRLRASNTTENILTLLVDEIGPTTYIEFA